jgi:putative addiction module component (TIGR02574 family)
MNAKVEVLVQEARKLTSEEQAELVDALLVGLHAPDGEIDQAWAEEIERRVQDMESGRSKPIPIENIPLLANWRRTAQ